jgi:AcrR family transcriptional regulator
MTEQAARPRRERRRTPRGDRRKAAIVDAAIAFFSRNGYRGASMAAIADAVDLTLPGLLHHFPSKEDLLVAVLEERDRRGKAAVDQEFDGPVLASLASLARRNTRSEALVKLFTVLVGEAAVSDVHPAHTHFAERYRKVVADVRNDLTADQQAGSFPADSDCELAARIMLAAMDGLQIQWLFDETFDMAGAVRALADVLGRCAVRAQPLRLGPPHQS